MSQRLPELTIKIGNNTMNVYERQQGDEYIVIVGMECAGGKETIVSQGVFMTYDAAKKQMIIEATEYMAVHL